MRPPPTQIRLLDNPADTTEIANLNNIITQYNTSKNSLDTKLHTSASSQTSILLAFNRARSRLGDILQECQNNPAIQATIAIEFNIERQYLIHTAFTKSYPPINLAPLPEPAPGPGPGPGPGPTTFTPDPDAERRAIIRAVSIGVGALSLSVGIGVISQVYKQGVKVALKKAAAPLAISGVSFLVGGTTYFDLRRRQSGTLPNIVIHPVTHGGT